MNIKFYSLWFDPTGNETQITRFTSTRPIHSTTDPLISTLTLNSTNFTAKECLEAKLVFTYSSYCEDLNTVQADISKFF